MNKPVIVSGMQPTGQLHLGNYLGALKNWLAIQDSGKYDCFFFIADYHSITINYDPIEKKQQVHNLLADFIAAGLDPQKSTIFIQSHIPECAELTWIFNTVTPIGELFRMTQFKDKSGIQKVKRALIKIEKEIDATHVYKQSETNKDLEFINRLRKITDEKEATKMAQQFLRDRILDLKETNEILKESSELYKQRLEFQEMTKSNAGLLDYPVLQAADILLYKGSLVPVGQDQIQHVELTRDCARWFNKKYKTEYFPESKPLLTEIPKVMSIAAPKNKMSKSLGDKHWIGIDDSPDAIANKLSKAVTTPEGIANLELLYNAFKDTMPGEFNPNKMSETKKILAQGIADYFAPFRKRKLELLQNKEALLAMIAEGEEKARVIAQQTMQDVKKIIGLL